MCETYAKAVERVHPDNKHPIVVMNPISVRNVMGNENSLLYQEVHESYSFKIDELDKEAAELSAAYREFLVHFAVLSTQVVFVFVLFMICRRKELWFR